MGAATSGGRGNPAGKQGLGFFSSGYHAVLATNVTSLEMDCEPGVVCDYLPVENSAFHRAKLDFPGVTGSHVLASFLPSAPLCQSWNSVLT